MWPFPCERAPPPGDISTALVHSRNPHSHSRAPSPHSLSRLHLDGGRLHRRWPHLRERRARQGKTASTPPHRGIGCGAMAGLSPASPRPEAGVARGGQTVRGFSRALLSAHRSLHDGDGGAALHGHKGGRAYRSPDAPLVSLLKPRVWGTRQRRHPAPKSVSRGARQSGSLTPMLLVVRVPAATRRVTGCACAQLLHGRA